jgi:hypothetical protein
MAYLFHGDMDGFHVIPRICVGMLLKITYKMFKCIYYVLMAMRKKIQKINNSYSHSIFDYMQLDVIYDYFLGYVHGKRNYIQFIFQKLMNKP